MDKDLSLVSLCSEPDAVLSFCTGMDFEEKKWGWGSLGDMFGWLSRGKLMRKTCFVRGSLKANDRKWMGQMELHKRFVEECLLSWIENISEGRNELDTRERVLEEALQVFGEKEECKRRSEGWRIEVLNAPTKKELRKLRIGEEVKYADAWIRSLREAPAANTSV